MGNVIIPRYFFRKKPAPEDVTWANGSDRDVVNILSSAYNNEFDLSEFSGWAIGSERVINLTSTYLGNDSITMVLMHRSPYKLANGTTDCQFAVGMKNCFSDRKTIATDFDELLDYIPSSIKSIFKSHKINTVNYGNGEAVQQIKTFHFASAGEVGRMSDALDQSIFSQDEFTLNNQFDYYKDKGKWLKGYIYHNYDIWHLRGYMLNYSNGCYCTECYGTNYATKDLDAGTNNYGICLHGAI